MTQIANEITIYAPYDGAVLGTVPAASEQDVATALETAAAAQPAWAARPLHERADILLRYRDLVREHLDELATTLCRDNGKPIVQARGEISNQLTAVPAFVERAKHFHGQVFAPGAERGWDHHLQLAMREPVGVIASVIPFNFPANMVAQKIIPGLLMGNAVLALPPSGNPLTVIALVELLWEAGVPREVLPCLVAPGAVKEVVATDPHTSLITLTGSTKTGKRIAEVAARRLVRCTLELGGNDPFIVCEDADLDLAVKEAIPGRMTNAGQICCASKRFIIHESMVDEFTKRMVEALSQFKTGNPLDETTQISCLINEKAACEVESQIARTVEQGAQVLLGGTREGAFVAPTVLGGVTADMDIAHDMEVFGPVVPIMSFADEAEAISIANDTVYGLAAAVFTENPHTFQRLARQLAAGTVVANGSSYLRSFEMPFGGWKESGVGTEGVASSLEEVTQLKMVIWKNLLD